MSAPEPGVDVLCFAPHPDDAELFCGGILGRLADLGHRVCVADLTRGERASNGTPEERAREADAAARVLGLAARVNLGLPDTGLHAHDERQVRRVVACVRGWRPELVLLPWIEERHPDHEEAAALCARAVYLAGVRNVPAEALPGEPEPAPRFVPRQILYYELRVHMPPSFIVDTTVAAARKLEAISCYRSQVVRAPGGDATLVSAPGAVDAILARDRHRGSLIGVGHGEALRAAAVPGLVDPVKHYRDNPFPEAHAFEPRH